MSDIKPIETEYNNRKFRSRIEARFAVFFDALGVRYDYEPEGYELESGRYLPDFYLPDLDQYLEIKGGGMGRDEAILAYAKAKELAIKSGKFVFIFAQGIRPEIITTEDDVKISGYGTYFAPDGDSDGMMTFGICPCCNKFLIGYHGSHNITYNSKIDPPVCAEAKIKQTEYGGISYDKHPRILEAIRKAMSARFEHGEKG